MAGPGSRAAGAAAGQQQQHEKRGARDAARGQSRPYIIAEDGRTRPIDYDRDQFSRRCHGPAMPVLFNGS